MEPNPLNNPANPLVTIIAICHKHAPYVVETLDSIRLQTYPNIELIIINNLQDECEAIIREWIAAHQVTCRFIQNEQPLSITQNCNLGIRYTSGLFIKPIACDDILMASLVSKQVEKINTCRDLQVGLCFTDMAYIDAKGELLEKEHTFLERLRERFPEQIKKDYVDYKSLLSATNPIPAPTALYFKSAIEAVGFFNEEIEIEDYSMNLALFASGFHFVYVNEVLVNYRVLEGSLSMVFRREKYYQNYNLLKEYSSVLDTENKYYRQKLWRGLLLMPDFYSFTKELRQYHRTTNDTNVLNYCKLIFHFIIGTVKRKPINRI